MKTNLPKLATGSVKDVLGPVTLQSQQGETIQGALFQYSNAYSVFDWGRMPDELAGKGEALTLLAAVLFERLENPQTWKEFSRQPEAMSIRKGVQALSQEDSLRTQGSGNLNSPAVSLSASFNELGEKLQNRGMATHYVGAVGEDLLSREDLSVFPAFRTQQWKVYMRHLAVRQVSVVRPRIESVMGKSVMDYQPTRTAPAPRLLPLEVVFRFGAPQGSSLLDRVAAEPALWSRLASPKALLPQTLTAGATFEFPVIELFTKLESTDRALTTTEALAIAGISGAQLQDVLLRTLWVAGALKYWARVAGLELWDGKLEWAVDASGEPVLVDAIGPDELRLTAGGAPLSKEFLREFYRKTDWYREVVEAKAGAKASGTTDWKRGVKLNPPALTEGTRALATQLYPLLANALSGQKWFPEAWTLEQWVNAYLEGPEVALHRFRAGLEASVTETRPSTSEKMA